MGRRTAWIGSGIGLALLLVVLGARLATHPGPATHHITTPPPPPAAPVAQADSPDDDDSLPVPPVPPRIAEGQDYEHCLDLLRTDPAGASSFADAWEATGGTEGARHCHALATITLGNAESGAEQLERLAADSPAPAIARASVYAQAAQAWLLAGDASRAYSADTLALALSPDDADTLVDRSIAAGSLKRFADAVTDLNRALTIDPQRTEALVFRGAALRHLNQLDSARADIAAALKSDPDNAEALLERGILRQRGGDRAGARADWKRAEQVAPDSPAADLAEQNLALQDAGPGQGRDTGR